MLFRQLFDAESCTYTYLLASDYGQDAIIIDSVDRQVPLYLQLINELNLNLVLALDTHLHADHVTGMGKLHQKLGCDMMLGYRTKAINVTKRAKEGVPIIIGELQLNPLYTPGHTSDSYCFVVEDRVFTGDLLMIRRTGRTDFQEGNAMQAYDSIVSKLFKLPDETFVYPAHDYAGMTVSTIGEEKRFNPRLQVNSADEFAAIMNSLHLPKPKLIDTALPANQSCGL